MSSSRHPAERNRRRALAHIRKQATRRLWVYASGSLLGMALLAGVSPPSGTYTTAAPPPPLPPPQAVGSATPAPPALDEPLRIIYTARQAYQGVRDYSCTLIKRERLQGVLQPDSVIAMKVRSQPFSVDLRWLEPRSEAGQEACYIAGRNNGMMRVHSPGILGAVGFLSIDPRDPRAQASSRHAITEAGIGNLIERFARYWENERGLNLTQVRIADYDFNKRRCTRVETFHPVNNGQFLAFRNVLYFDKENRLPIRCESYDWPRRGGSPEGDLVEVYSYTDLRLNVGVPDEVFNH